MKFNEGAWLDGKPNNNPLNTTRLGRNLVYDYSKGAFTNERGNVYITNYGTNRTALGFVLLDGNDFLVFSKVDEGQSSIGYVSDQLVYTELKNDPKLGFKYTHPIHGEFQRTPNGQRVVAFTDSRTSFKYYNIDTNTDLNNMEVFSHVNRPGIVTSIIAGGGLKAGAWYIIARYEKSDGTLTSWVRDYSPVILGTTISKTTVQQADSRAGMLPNTTTSNSIRLQITGMDQRYKRMELGVVFQANNIKLAYRFRTISVQTGTQLVVLSSMNELEAITLNEVLIDRANYKSIEHLTQYENTLYAAGLTAYTEQIHQGQLNNLTLKYRSTLVNFGQQVSFRDHQYNNRVKHFQHGEVYAIYIRFRYYWGYGQWWHVPGRTSETGELGYTGEDFRNYQLNDTCGLDGKLGYWENEDEKYPEQEYYPLGNVRHIKFPSINWMKQNVYANDPQYGSSKMDILNLEVSGIILDNFKDCDGMPALSYQVGYAKRDGTNGLVVGQTIFIGSVDYEANPEVIYTSLGMNTQFIDPTASQNTLKINLKKVRTYDYRMLFNKEAPTINFIRPEVILSDYFDIVDKKDPAYNYNNVRRGIAEYYKNNAQLSTIGPVRVTDSKFVFNNTVLGNVDNTFLEDTVVLDLDEALVLPKVQDTTGVNWGEIHHFTQLITLLTIRRNCYNSFTDQQIVVCDEQPGAYGGDAFINVSSITTFGTTSQKTFSNDPEKSNDDNTPFNGTRIAHVFLSESMFNLGFRYVNPATIGGSTKFAPHDDPTAYLPRLRRDQEPNLLTQGYSVDYNALNDLSFSDIFNELQEENRISHRPFVGIRGQRVVDGVEFSPWIDFRINDVYQLDRTRGRLVNFTAGKDFLIFHHEKALMVTRTRNYLDAGGESVFVGTGDVFEAPPIEIVHSKLGSLGTQHKWSCQMTPYGYFFLDAEQGRYWNWDGSPKVISNSGMTAFFRDNSFNPGDNPFSGDGWFTVLDEINNRILITKKHKKLTADYKERYKGIWRNEKNFLSSLKKGDVVYKDGRLQFVN